MRTPLLLAGLALVLTACSDDASPVAGPVTGPSASAEASPSAAASPAPAPAPASAAPAPSPVPSGPEDPLVPRPGLESPAPLGAPACVAKDLTVVDADSIVTPSTVQQVYVVRTTGPDCQLEGFPGVELRGADGKALPATVGENGFGLPDERPEAVSLSRSTSVSFRIGTARSGDCRQADTIVVNLPGTSGGLTAATFLQVCGGAVGVSPVERSGTDH